MRYKVTSQFLSFAVITSFILGCVSATDQLRSESLKSDISEEEAFYFDFDSFMGEKIVLEEKHSAQITKLNLKITLPDQYQLLPKANPTARLFTKEQDLLKTIPITETMSSSPINEIIVSETLYAQLSLFYCRDAPKGLCIIKEVLFEIPIDKQLSPSDLELSYTVPDMIF